MEPSAARVLLVGVGGLGAPAAIALAEAGVAAIGLCDFDVVDATNLHRQIVFRSGDVGRLKVDAAAERLAAFAPGVRVERRRVRADLATMRELVRGHDLVVEGTDSFEAKFACNAAAVEAGVPLVTAGVVGFHGTLMVVAPGGRPCYRCVFEAPPDASCEMPTCAQAGVLGAVAGVFGALLAVEGLALLRAGAPARGPLVHWDALAGRMRRREVRGRADCPTCGRARSTETESKERRMAISVHIPTPLRKYTGGKGEVAASGANVSQVLDDLEKSYPGLKERLCDPNGQVRRFVNIFANEEDIRVMQGIDTPVKDGDEISIVPAIAGGV